jgi:hypothetical protein
MSQQLILAIILLGTGLCIVGSVMLIAEKRAAVRVIAPIILCVAAMAAAALIAYFVDVRYALVTVLLFPVFWRLRSRLHEPR